MAILDAFYSLGRNINKVRGNKNTTEMEEGIVSEKLPELALDMKDTDLIDLTEKWEREWKDSDVYNKWVAAGDENEKYWLGNQFDTATVDKNRAQVDNVIFEALETYLPQITRRNPDPMVTLDEGEDQGNKDNQAYVANLQKALARIAKKIKLRLKLKKAGRHQSIYLLAAAKLGWDVDKDIPTMKIVRARKLILDPTAVNDEDGYSGERVGEYRKMQAGKMLAMLDIVGGEAEGIKALKEAIGDNLGTEVQFIEWWTTEYMCWKMKDKILLKKKNPHWNYEPEAPEPQTDPNTGEPMLDENGQPVMGEQQPALQNFFESPKMPWLFLVVFNLGKGPVDDTSLMGQNLANQDTINKRNKQIDKNADSMNGGMVVSGERSGLTQQQSSKVTEALRKGGTVYIPAGSVQDAVARMSAPGLPADIYNDLADKRNRVRDIFGTRGSSAAGLETERTVRGKIQNRSLDTDRIGGGLSEYLEQFAGDIYGWFVQLLYVYDEKYIAMQKPRVGVEVKDGSMLPKDSVSIANQAIELAGAGKMSLIDLYKRLDDPNPEETAANVWLEVNAPEILFANDPRVAQVVQQKQAAAAQAANPSKPPSESISYKDLPPEGQAQMAAKVGIQLHPEAIAAHDAHVADAEAARSMLTRPTGDKSGDTVHK